MSVRRLATSCVLGAALAGTVPAPATAQSPFDRSTPERTLRGFLAAAHRGDQVSAASALEAGPETPEERARTAERLAFVLDRTLWLDLTELPDDRPSVEGERVELAELPDGIGTTPLVLVAVPGPSGRLGWAIARDVVDRVPELYAEHGPTWLEAYLPPWTRRTEVAGVSVWQLLAGLLVATLALFLGSLAGSVVFRLGSKIASRTAAPWDDELAIGVRGPVRAVLTVLFAWAMTVPLGLSAATRGTFDRLGRVALVLALAWAAHRATGVVASLLERRALRATSAEPGALGRLRGLRTQVAVLRRVVAVVVVVVAGALVLVQFDGVRTIGLSLLASAGMAGIVIGLAAQRSIATLLAGVQLSITQPIRLGDVVVVESEWGTIEEITLTYVVVRIWDERRLVVPMTKFLESPFQNWTKASAELLGTVFFHADFGIEVEDVRRELDRILDGHPKWDGRVKGVAVTDAKDRTLELRALVSARNADDQWDLRCDVREKLVAWLRRHEGGRHLPKYRLDSPVRDRAGVS